jgi:hypothetical protein
LVNTLKIKENIMVFKVNSGIVNNQTLSGGLRFFKIVGPFAWTVSDGSVNLPVSVSGGDSTITTYFTVGNGKPVPNSAADLALQEISKMADIVLIGLVPSLGALTTEIDIAVSASAFGWGSDTPSYTTPPANADETQLPTTPTAAATQMQAAIRALPSATVYVTTGGTQFTATTGTGTTVMNISAVSTGVVKVGQVLTGGTLSGTAYITSFGTFNGTSGTVNLSVAQTFANPTTVTAIPDSSLAPVTATASFASATVTEVSFSLGSLTYYNLS